MLDQDRDRRVTDAVSRSGSTTEAALKAGVSRQTVMRVSERLGLDVSHFPRGRSGTDNSNYRHGKCLRQSICLCGRKKDIRAMRCAICSHRGYSKSGEKIVSDDDVIKAVAGNDTFLKAARSLDVSRKVVNRVAERLGLDISHFRKGRGRPYTDVELFRSGHKHRVVVRSRFYQLDPSKYTCSLCPQGPVWNGKPLKLEVDHINGDRTDNRVENLRWICPNCHSQQPTMRGMNYHRYGNKRRSNKEIEKAQEMFRILDQKR